ncbi:hypothetical protein B0H14DRAFT_3456504 [Mycena olivaceomarginata]|nr:hypothetical protein B0H14DRAFT_3456504 [Mycena olivaceomarginata]
MCNFFFIWMCIRRPWLSRIRYASDDAVSWGFTTQTWRDILSGQYWKYRHPKNGSEPFNVRRFWKHGGPLVFVDESVSDMEADISPEMEGSTTGRLEPATFTDERVRALVLWDLTLCHSQFQLDRADEILCTSALVDDWERSVRRRRRADLFHNASWNWNIPKDLPPWEEHLGHRRRRHWLSRLLEVVRHWPSASKMDWFLGEQNFAKVKGSGGQSAEAKFCEALSDGKLHLLEMSLIAAYYQGVFDALGILAVGILQRPTTLDGLDAFYTM